MLEEHAAEFQEALNQRKKAASATIIEAVAAPPCELDEFLVSFRLEEAASGLHERGIHSLHTLLATERAIIDEALREAGVRAMPLRRFWQAVEGLLALPLFAASIQKIREESTTAVNAV